MFPWDDVAVFVDESNIDLDRGVVFGSDETVRSSTVGKLVNLHVGGERGVSPFARNVEVDDLSLILKSAVSKNSID